MSFEPRGDETLRRAFVGSLEIIGVGETTTNFLWVAGAVPAIGIEERPAANLKAAWKAAA